MDRRRSERRPFHCTAQLELKGHSPKEIRIHEIGTDGMSFVAELNIAARTVCAIKFSLAGNHLLANQNFHIKARVVHSILSGRVHGFLIGVIFEESSSNAYQQIEAYLTPLS